MKYLQKHPIIMIIVGVIGISLSSILVKLSTAPSAVTATFRLLWTVILMTPVIVSNNKIRQEIRSFDKKSVILSIISGIFLAIHFVVWFESLNHTSVASSTTLVCTEVIWVSLGYCLFMKGRISKKAIIAIAVAFAGSAVIAFADTTSGAGLYGDILAIVSAIAVAIYMLIGRVVRKKYSTTVYTYVVYASCFISLALFCVFTKTSLFTHGINVIIIGLLLAVFSTILGHSIFSWCLKFFSPSFVSASKLCEPVVAAIIAIPVFSQLPSLLQIIGGTLILGGVFYYSQIEKNEQ